MPRGSTGLPGVQVTRLAPRRAGFGEGAAYDAKVRFRHVRAEELRPVAAAALAVVAPEGLRDQPRVVADLPRQVLEQKLRQVQQRDRVAAAGALEQPVAQPQETVEGRRAAG